MTIVLATLFCAVALVYASVGLGGGSAYIAILAFVGLPRETIVPVALACNVIVAGTSCYHYARAGFLRWRLLLPFVLTSIPAAYLGSITPLNPRAFMLLLGGSLIVAAVRTVFCNGNVASRQPSPDFMAGSPVARKHEIYGGRRPAVGDRNYLLSLPIGAALGFLAGLVGIGGGIFLIPVLLLLRWASPKEAASLGAAFVTLNSLSGLAGYVAHPAISTLLLAALVVAVIVGSQLGARFGARHWSAAAVQGTIAVVLSVAGVQLIWRAL